MWLLREKKPIEIITFYVSHILSLPAFFPPYIIKFLFSKVISSPHTQSFFSHCDPTSRKRKEKILITLKWETFFLFTCIYDKHPLTLLTYCLRHTRKKLITVKWIWIFNVINPNVILCQQQHRIMVYNNMKMILILNVDKH